eukprot:SAG11_NODE_912_length_6580_cov_2.243018_6_plen_312_part_00
MATLNHGAGVTVRDGGQILNSKLLRNGQQGFHSDRGGNILIAKNEVAYNNWAGFDTGWEAGAGKLGRADNDGGTGPGHELTGDEHSVLRDNFVHHNWGRGLWADVGDTRVSYLNNIVINNTHEGIAHEISHQAIIEGNTVCFNGAAFDVWQWGSQIVVQNSDNVLVANNTVVVGRDGGNGIGLIYQPRNLGHTPAITKNDTVVGNTVIVLDPNASAHGFSGAVGNCNAAAHGCFVEEMWNTSTFERNGYVFAGTAAASTQGRFKWRAAGSGSGAISFSQWQAAGNDVRGSAVQLNAGVVPAACFRAPGGED